MRCSSLYLRFPFCANNAAIVHEGHPVSETEDAAIMGGHQNRAVRPYRSFEQEFHDGMPRRRIKGRSWLITHDQAGPVDERTGESHPLLLSS
jgi:hypothetical protein